MAMKKLEPPTNLEPGYLYKKYEPLRKAMFNKFKDRMANYTDKTELQSEIDHIFLELVNEYNPNRGVDFPYYIKRMMDLRVYHYITKYLKNINSETYDEELLIEDDSMRETLERVINLNSLDPNIVLGEKHRRLMVGVLIEHKTLKELAAEEGVPTDRLNARLYFLVKKLQKAHEEDVERYGEDLY